MVISIIIIAIIAALAFFAVRSLIRTKKSGGCVGCSGGADCPSCHTKK